MGSCAKSLLSGEYHFMMCYTHSSVDIALPEDRYQLVKVGEDRLLSVSAADDQGRSSQSLPDSTASLLSYLAYPKTSAIGYVMDFMLTHHNTRPVMARVFDIHLEAVLKKWPARGEA